MRQNVGERPFTSVEIAYEHIVAALDGSPASELVLQHAVLHARAFHASLSLVRVVQPFLLTSVSPDITVSAAVGGLPDVGVVSAVARDELEAKAYLERYATPLRESGLTVSTSVRVGPVADNILREVVEGQADLVVLSTQGRAGFARMVLGSVADEVVRQSPCAVLLIRIPDVERPAESTRMRSFRDDAEAAGPLAPMNLGNRTVDVSRIVGSVGRAQELGLDFRPLVRRPRDDRFHRILGLMERGEGLPPIELYKLGYHYYVLDGNHRVAAAKQIGQVDMDADVTEFVPVNDETQQRLFAERRAFEQVTGLTRVGASKLGTLPSLERLIRAYAAEVGMAEEADDEATLRAAARGWYSNVYYPTAQRLRAAHVGDSFPGERTADIVMRLADFRDREADLTGHDIPWDEGVQRFVGAHGRARTSVLEYVPGLRSLLKGSRARDEH